MSIIAVTGGKGGTGRSCVAAYTAQALARNGKKTLLIELGAGGRSLDIMLGVHGEILFDISDLAAGRCEPEQVIIPINGNPGLFLLPGCPFLSRENGNYSDCFDTLGIDAGDFDHLILDGVDFSAFAPSKIDTVLLVVTPDSLSARAASIHAAELYGAGAKNIRLVINNVPSQLQPILGAEDFDDLIDITGAQLISVIPHSPKLTYASNHGIPLDSDTITYKVFDNLAARLLGLNRPLLIR